ncbi:MAG: SDR family NAD(P)-dependent oxidoreductase, partial [Pseudomonadota bacterium]
MYLDQKTIIITGASSGIGRAAAKRCAALGARVVLGARRAERLATLCQEIRDAGGEAISLAGDVASGAYATELVALAEDGFGGLDAALNNAGLTGDLGSVPQ